MRWIIERIKFTIFYWRVAIIFKDKYLSMFIKDNLSYLWRNYEGWYLSYESYIDTLKRFIDKENKYIENAYQYYTCYKNDIIEPEKAEIAMMIIDKYFLEQINNLVSAVCLYKRG